MAKALTPGEKVHILAYDETLKAHILDTLEKEGIDLKQIDIVLAKSDDTWARDTGPMFVKDQEGQLKIVDFAFDAWGKKTPYKHDDAIAQKEDASYFQAVILAFSTFFLLVKIGREIKAIHRQF